MLSSPFPANPARGTIAYAYQHDGHGLPGQVKRPRKPFSTGVRMDKLPTEKQYSEAEVRQLVAQAFRECASIIHHAFSFPSAHLRCVTRAKEIEAGGSFQPPPHQQTRFP